VRAGLFNFELRTAYISFATKNVPDMGIQAGFVLKSAPTFLGMNSETDIRLDTSGYVKFAMSFDGSELVVRGGP
jgi:hypothetical protein